MVNLNKFNKLGCYYYYYYYYMIDNYVIHMESRNRNKLTNSTEIISTDIYSTDYKWLNLHRRHVYIEKNDN